MELGVLGSVRVVCDGVEVRVTGFWRWKTVLVPPNAFVVHTRRGRPDPLHLGLGVSFRFNPATDEHGRKVAYVGRSMVRNMGIARDLGLLRIPPALVVSAHN